MDRMEREREREKGKAASFGKRFRVSQGVGSTTGGVSETREGGKNWGSEEKVYKEEREKGVSGKMI